MTEYLLAMQDVDDIRKVIGQVSLEIVKQQFEVLEEHVTGVACTKHRKYTKHRKASFVIRIEI